jgi:hypothetical protein
MKQKLPSRGKSCLGLEKDKERDMGLEKDKERDIQKVYISHNIDSWTNFCVTTRFKFGF